jgi:exopolysaccharide production protein ExoZ
MSIVASSQQGNKLETLQIVRAVASTSVVYSHIGSAPCFGGNGLLPCFGGFGVDMFFVLSGFVMAMLIASGQPGSRFVIGRISRIVPLYWTLTTLILLVAVLRPDLLNSTTGNLSNYLRSIFFIPYFKENGTLMPLLFVGWTLNYEMFFYFCVWISLITLNKHAVWMTAGLILVAQIGFGYYADSRVLNRFFGNYHMYEWALGMIAYWVHRKRYLGNISTKVMFAVGLAGYLFMATVEVQAVHISRLLLYGLPSFLVVCSIVRLEGILHSVPRMLGSALIGIGNASYSTYLSHIYVTQAVRKVLDEKLHVVDINGIFGVALALSVALVTGVLIHTFVDAPLSRWCKKRMEKVFEYLKNVSGASRGRSREVHSQDSTR